VGHSRVVAELAAQAGARLGLDGPQVGALRRAGHVLDLGRIGVPNRVWGKTSALSTAEKERVRLHPYLIQRILARVDAVHGIAQLAGAHHERLDGSGYPQGTSGAELRLPERVLAAADTYQSLREPHPHQPAHGPDGATEVLREEVRAGRLDGPAVEAILAAAGHTRPARGSWPAGLTDREVDVLRLIARGCSAIEVGTELHIAPKTARNHGAHRTLSSPVAGLRERFAGYDVMGLPFRSDHYLALRHFPANTFGRPYHSVRHRGSDATWVLDEGTPISASCTGHSDAAISAASMVDISIMWTGPCRLSLEVRGALVWNIELQRTQDRANDWRRSADAARDVGPPRGARRDGMCGRTGSRSRASSAGGDCAGRSVVQGEPAPDPEHRRQPRRRRRGRRRAARSTPRADAARRLLAAPARDLLGGRNQCREFRPGLPPAAHPGPGLLRRHPGPGSPAGCSWDLAARLCRANQTALRGRRTQWPTTGVFDQLVEEAIAGYDKIIGLELSEVAVHGSPHKTPCGGEGTAASRRRPRTPAGH